jgi:hypothetical protein
LPLAPLVPLDERAAGPGAPAGAQAAPWVRQAGWALPDAPEPLQDARAPLPAAPVSAGMAVQTAATDRR